MVYNLVADKALFDRIEANELRAIILPSGIDFQSMDQIALTRRIDKLATEKKVRCQIDHVMAEAAGLQPGYRMLSISVIDDHDE